MKHNFHARDMHKWNKPKVIPDARRKANKEFCREQNRNYDEPARDQSKQGSRD